jgi:hypothetical protein
MLPLPDAHQSNLAGQPARDYSKPQAVSACAFALSQHRCYSALGESAKNVSFDCNSGSPGQRSARVGPGRGAARATVGKSASVVLGRSRVNVSDASKGAGAWLTRLQGAEEAEGAPCMARGGAGPGGAEKLGRLLAKGDTHAGCADWNKGQNSAPGNRGQAVPAIKSGVIVQLG